MNWLKKFFRLREKSDGDIVKPFLEHMEDLRWMLLKMLVTIVCAMIVAFFFVDHLMWLLQQPLNKVDPKLVGELVTINITDSFVISLQLAFFAGVVFALPFLIYFLAGFILPALSRTEKRYLFPGIFGGFVLFCCGVAASYFYLLPKTLHFFYDYSHKMGVRILWTWKDYVSFCTWLTIGLGLLCQLPVLVIALSALGLIDYHFLARTRTYAIAAILILAAFIAPTPDPMTFLSLGLPIILLYEACIWIVWLLDRRKQRRRDENRDKVDDDDLRLE